MFDMISVPRSAKSSYYGIPTQKDGAVEYLHNTKQPYGVKLGFLENTNTVIVLSGELEKPLTGTWSIVLRDLKDAATYKVTVSFKENVLLMVADNKGVIWCADTGISQQLYDQCLDMAGCRDTVLAAKERERQAAEDRGETIGWRR